MSPGTFLFDDNFRFHDGNIGQKIFVLLNNGSTGIYVAAKTTSHGDRYGIQHGCQILDRFLNFYLVQGSCFLKKNTWIQLDSFYEFKSDKLMEKVMIGEIKRIGVIEPRQTIELLKCASHSDDLSQSQETIVISSLETIKASVSPEAI
ncbi:hypothetical protein [Candidatus Thiosymbion oneisti]|uniref:hypothetical protein n=1 Tax=Candidatus Thiosymbion oneisti TaxID=589554 RepID=UPI000B7DF3E5|nr:hypothetical protein [Candidatus Thiosymbion oneisti]